MSSAIWSGVYAATVLLLGVWFAGGLVAILDRRWRRG